ncbi:MAG TPA: PIG-L deacetylase family protein [Bacteroidales bacterium]|nr:PIG-L deacetylase family protein [Bacteroidales bacterium]
MNNTKPLNILCLGAHCDDIEIGAGGTLLKIFANYKINSVKWVVFSSNELRKKEAINSAAQFLEKIGNSDVIVHSYRDGFLPFLAAEVKDKFEELKRTFQPDLIFTHYRDDRHQDHRLVSDLTWNTWRNHTILEYEIPKYDGDLGTPNFYVPLEEHYINRRNGVLMNAFESQRDKHWFDDETFKALPRLRGMESASKYAEAFFARKIVM